MKLKYGVCVVALWVCSARVLAQFGPELIVNGDLEGASRDTDWNAYVLGVNDPPGSPFFADDFGICLEGVFRGAEGLRHGGYQDVTVEPGKTYRLSFVLKPTAKPAGLTGITIWDSAGGSGDSAWSLVASNPAVHSVVDSGQTVRINAPLDTWTTQTIDLLALKNEIGIANGGVWDSTVRMDNFSLRELVPAVPQWGVNSSGDWNISGNWTSGGVPNAIDAVANFLGTITAPRTVFSDTAVTAGTVKFDNANTYQIAGNGALTIEVSSGSGSVSVAQGSHKINLPLIFASNTDVSIASGATLTIGDPATINAGKTVTKNGNLLIQAPLTIEAGGALVLASGPTTLFGAPSLGAGSGVDVKNTSVTVDTWARSANQRNS